MAKAMIAIGLPKKEEVMDEYQQGPLKFKIPEGLDLSGLKDGEEKEVLAVVKKDGDDQAELVSLDGVAITGADEEAAEEEYSNGDVEEEEEETPTFASKLSQKARSTGMM